jgi:hypothetical protein
MPAKKPIPEEISEEQVLAAIDRARRHQRNQNSAGVLRATIKDHLGLSRDGGSTVRLRPTWDALHDAGEIEYTHRHGLELWALTRRGVQRLARARQAGSIAPLPEAPQHRYWREARQLAGEQMERLRAELRDYLATASALLEQMPHDSEPWHELAPRLQARCLDLSSATHCLYEWPEPDDAVADVPPERYGGRRDMRWARRR